MGDPVRIRQILLNLLSNAVKFTEKGSVELRARAVKSHDAQAAQVIFEVQDTGIGISAEARSRLFQSFSQAEASTTRHYGGTGLGLAICKRLVEMMDGQVVVESEIGSGSTFRVTLNLQLPAVQISDSSPSSAVTKSARDGRVQSKILVAEDNQINQKVALRLLSLLGYSADVAKNGAEAVQMLKAGEYHAVLMDMQMPVMDGLEATRAIRQLDGALSRTPIIALTASAMQGESQKCFAAGMDDFISKPIENDKLAAVLERWTERREEGTISGGT